MLGASVHRVRAILAWAEERVKAVL
jgi:hypothetical protein